MSQHFGKLAHNSYVKNCKILLMYISAGLYSSNIGSPAYVHTPDVHVFFTGVKGEQGLMGVPGMIGTKGERGPRGPKGNTGLPGQ